MSLIRAVLSFDDEFFMREDDYDELPEELRHHIELIAEVSKKEPSKILEDLRNEWEEVAEVSRKDDEIQYSQIYRTGED
ncbi:hypothetical protein C7H79_14695 [Nitrosomonas supralitoralis]|uniref:Uncharacterized protein n=2 Tax=Nitrosomonas supralitoralis TaxID=2116706 RepID=A0A2P7NRX7_9PROT|nr:hypothetical protein C7H79_14695 [Nitrosomonas supralitoralis]